jgi:hypothetical protein
VHSLSRPHRRDIEAAGGDGGGSGAGEEGDSEREAGKRRQARGNRGDYAAAGSARSASRSLRRWRSPTKPLARRPRARITGGVRWRSIRGVLERGSMGPGWGRARKRAGLDNTERSTSVCPVSFRTVRRGADRVRRPTGREGDGSSGQPVTRVIDQQVSWQLNICPSRSSSLAYQFTCASRAADLLPAPMSPTVDSAEPADDEMDTFKRESRAAPMEAMMEVEDKMEVGEVGAGGGAGGGGGGLGGGGVRAEGGSSAPARSSLTKPPCMYDTTARRTSMSKDEAVHIPAVTTAPHNTSTPSIYEAGANTQVSRPL